MPDSPDKPKPPLFAGNIHGDVPTLSAEERKRQMAEFKATLKSGQKLRVVEDAGFPRKPGKKR